MTPQLARKMLLLNGVKNLKEFGYTNVSIENILGDFVYGKVFLGMLEEWRHRDREDIEDTKQRRQQKVIDDELEKLIIELKAI